MKSLKWPISIPGSCSPHQWYKLHESRSIAIAIWPISMANEGGDCIKSPQSIIQIQRRLDRCPYQVLKMFGQESIDVGWGLQRSSTTLYLRIGSTAMFLQTTIKHILPLSIASTLVWVSASLFLTYMYSYDKALMSVEKPSSATVIDLSGDSFLFLIISLKRNSASASCKNSLGAL